MYIKNVLCKIWPIFWSVIHIFVRFVSIYGHKAQQFNIILYSYNCHAFHSRFCQRKWSNQHENEGCEQVQLFIEKLIAPRRSRIVEYFTTICRTESLSKVIFMREHVIALSVFVRSVFAQDEFRLRAYAI